MTLDLDAIEKERQEIAFSSNPGVHFDFYGKWFPQLIARIRELQEHAATCQKRFYKANALNKEKDQRIKVLERALEFCHQAFFIEAGTKARRMGLPIDNIYKVENFIQQAERDIADNPDESLWVQNDRMEQSK